MLELIRDYFPEYRHYRGRLALAFIGMLMVAGASAGIAWMMKPLLDEVFVKRNIELLHWLPMLVVLAYLAKGLGAFTQAYMMSYVGQDIVRKVRDRLLAHMLRLELGFFHRHHSGDLISRITADTGRIQGAVSTSLATLLRETLTAAALIGVVIYQSPTLSFITLVVIPAAYYPVALISRKLKRISHMSQERTATLTMSLAEAFNHVEAIKAYHTETFEADRFAHANRALFAANIRSARTAGLVVPVMELFASFSAALVIYVGGRQVIEGQLSVGEFFSFMTALLMAIDPIRRISSTYTQFQDAVAANERIKAMLALTPEPLRGERALDDVDSIALEGAELRHGERCVLRGIDLSARKGEVIALVGGSGGGKSSIAALLLRFFEARAGRVRINGHDIGEYRLDAVRRRIALVSQRIHLFNDSIAANVAYGAEIDEARVVAALRKANILDHVAGLEHGIHTRLNEAGSNLSGGQRQRIAIARALYRDPRVLILDEATSALDNASEAAILATLRELAPDIITIIIAHRLKSVEQADRIYLIQDGRVACVGGRDELLRDCAEFRGLYR